VAEVDFLRWCGQVSSRRATWTPGQVVAGQTAGTFSASLLRLPRALTVGNSSALRLACDKQEMRAGLANIRDQLHSLRESKVKAKDRDERDSSSLLCSCGCSTRNARTHPSSSSGRSLCTHCFRQTRARLKQIWSAHLWAFCSRLNGTAPSQSVRPAG